MITVQNYHDKIKDVEFSTMPEAIRKGHEFVKKVTDNGAHWDNYHNSDTIKKTVNTYFEKLAAYLSAGNKPHTVKQFDKSRNDWVAKEKKQSKAKTSKQPGKPTSTASLVERIPDELRFIRRYINLDGKTKTREDILRFINSLQKAILEKKIRKTSFYAKEVRYIQDKLIEVYNGMKAKIALMLTPDTKEKLLAIVHGEKVMPSVNFIKRYIGMNGRDGMKEKARLLLTQINKAYSTDKVNDSDPYIVEMHEIKKNLENFLAEKHIKVLEIEKNTLSGLQGLVNGCMCQHLNGFDGDEVDEKPTVMSSMEFADMQFRSLGFKGKWLELIGDPSSHFTLMVFGRPKFGKSYLCIEFAGYLARNHGKVLYIAKEEGLDKTLQDKLNDKDVKHPNLYVASSLPASLSFYDFIFLDSVNKLGMTPDDLTRLKAMYPEKSFIYVFQTTKEGKFRGANTFQHDVDAVIEVPEKGRAVQYGRFNQGGEMPIF